MANYFTNLFSTAANGFARMVAGYINDGMSAAYTIERDYYQGDHRRQLKVREGQGDDNVFQNYTGLVIDRSASRMLRGGVEFKLPEGSDEAQAYLEEVWDANNKDIFLHQCALHGGVFGTPYIKIIVDGKEYEGKTYPRLVALYPEIVRIKAAADDMDKIIEYRVEYAVVSDGKETAYREITSLQPDGNSWVITYEIKEGYSQWRQDKPDVLWGYEFPPIIHWKNLPSLNSVYGTSDIDDIVNIQDKSNFTVSNISKIVKYYAHPQTVGIGFSVDTLKNNRVETSVGSFTAIPNPEASVANLEMSSDLASSRALSLDLRRSLFDIGREVDLSSMADRLGALTNFGLKVLYSDALDKNDTKRQLYGAALNEVNRRLLILAGMKPVEMEVAWGNALVEDVGEEMNVDNLAIKMGIIDRQTVAERWQTRYGVDWETIQTRLGGVSNAQFKNAPDDVARRAMEARATEALGKYLDGQKERVTNDLAG